MPVKPGVVDTNVLVYALDADAPQHAASRACSPSRPRRGRHPLRHIANIVRVLFRRHQRAPRSKPLLPCRRDRGDFFPARFSSRVGGANTHGRGDFIRLLRRRPVTGGDIFDLQILATMNVNGIQSIYTFNAADFVSFPEIAVLTP